MKFRCVLAAPIAAAAFAISAIAAPSALAVNATPFCPPVAFSSVTINANDRCVSGLFYTLTQVQSSLNNGAGVQHCAVGKQYSDGSGHNVIDPTCNALQTNYSACLGNGTGATVGYATQINQSASAHKYFGYAAYGNSGCLA